MTRVTCGWCGYEYPNPEKIAAQKPHERELCPKCGSTSLDFNVNVSSKVKLRSMIGFKFRVQGAKKPSTEFKEGSELHRDTGKWRKLRREINRDKNRYYEEIIDEEAGATIRLVDEPLTDHKNRGSAKKKKK